MVAQAKQKTEFEIIFDPSEWLSHNKTIKMESMPRVSVGWRKGESKVFHVDARFKAKREKKSFLFSRL